MNLKALLIRYNNLTINIYKQILFNAKLLIEIIANFSKFNFIYFFLNDEICFMII